MSLERPAGRDRSETAAAGSRSLAAARDRWRLWTQAGVVLFSLGSVAFLLFGQLNNDEAWYLYASRLVLQGALPYRDFVFPQMPLLPYVYAVSQGLGPSLIWGRVTSILLSFGTIGLGLGVARRYGGERAAALTSLLSAFFLLSIYYDSIVKSYSLVAFLFAATLFFLTSDRPDSQKYPLAVGFALLAVLARLTAIFFVAPILLYALFSGPLKSRILAMLEAGATGLVAAGFLLPDWPIASWNLIGSHLTHWGDTSQLDQIRAIVTDRVSTVAQDVGPLVVLGAAGLVLLWLERNSKSWPMPPRPLLLVSVGLVLFAASHLVNGLFEVEYLVPAAVAFLPILAIALARVLGEATPSSRTFIGGAIAAAAILLIFTENTQHLQERGGSLPLQQVGDVAAYIDQNSGPSDQILVFEALGAVYQANRAPLPGMTLAQFSLQGVDDPTAQRLHVVTYSQTVQYVSQKAPRLVILTDADWEMLGNASPPDAPELKQALNQNYTLTVTLPEFGQFSRTLYIYARR